MKILIVTQYYYPEQFQINEIAPALVRRGHEVTVLTGLPNYPKGEIYEGYEQGYLQPEYVDGVKIIRVKARPRRTGGKNLILNYIDFFRKANKKAVKLDKDFDIVVSYQLSPVTMAYPAIKYAKKHKKPLFLYCLDIWPESAQAHVKTDKGLVYGLIKKLSKSIYQRCDKISVTSKKFIEYLRDLNGVDEEKMSYIPQHADDRYLGMDFTAPNDDIIDFMYAGNLGVGQKIDVLLRAFAEIKLRENIRLHLVGDGSYRGELEKLSKELGVEDKVVFHGNQRREDMPSFYKFADALLISLRGNNAVGNTLPGKLQAYMSVGKPIFGAINGASEVIEEAGCGACAPAEDYLGLAKLLEDFIDNPQKYAECGARAREYFAANFTLDIFMDRFEGELQELIQ